MIELSGKNLSKAMEAVTGRMYRAEQAERAPSNSAAIVFWSGEHELDDVALRNAVGLLIPSTLDGERLKHAVRLAEFRHIPTLGLSQGLSDDAFTAAKIAILDAYTQKLYVNPDLETVTCFFKASTRRKANSVSLIVKLPQSADELPHGCNGVLVGTELDGAMCETEAYEHFCDVAERFTGAQLVAVADLSSGNDCFISRVRAIYRAGVWGRYSLLCKGIKTPENATLCISLIHQAFRLLDEEGREFNGFMPKGVFIDTPLILLSAPTCRMLDFFVIDFDAVRYSLCQSHVPQDGCEQTVKYVSAFAKSAGSASIALKSAPCMSDATFRLLIEQAGVSEIFTTVDELERIKRIL